MVVKLYHPYTQFLRNFCLSHRRIATFSAHRDFLIIAPYKYYYLLTEEFLVDKYLWQLYEKKHVQTTWSEKILLESLECYRN